MDIDFKHCILDLIDNAVDAFTRSRRSSGSIDMTFNDEFFEIRDNCGGISEDDLLNTVFRFGGRISQSSENRLGIYGVGLKRAIFKIGNAFEFESFDGTNHNIVYEDDLAAWKMRDEPGTDSWKFRVKKGTPLRKEGYSRLKIYKLKDSYRKMITLRAQIARDVSIKYVMFMKEGLTFRVDEKPIVPIAFDMPSTEELQPATKTIEREDLKIRITCGYNPRVKRREKPPEGRYGWNIFCNDRLILVSDTTEMTGWGAPGNPGFHTLYYPFSGYVWINSNDVSKLPVNTMKTGLVPSSETYKLVLDEMWRLATPVLNYIYKVRLKDEESVIVEAEKAAEEKISEDAKKLGSTTDMKSIFEMKEDTDFKAPKASGELKQTGHIAYEKPLKEIDRMKKRMNVKSNKKAGERSFEYYLKEECGEL